MVAERQNIVETFTPRPRKISANSQVLELTYIYFSWLRQRGAKIIGIFTAEALIIINLLWFTRLNCS